MYIKINNIRKLANQHNKQISKSFINELNRIVYDITMKAINCHNGGAKRLTGELLAILYKNK